MISLSSFITGFKLKIITIIGTSIGSLKICSSAVNMIQYLVFCSGAISRNHLTTRRGNKQKNKHMVDYKSSKKNSRLHARLSETLHVTEILQDLQKRMFKHTRLIATCKYEFLFFQV